MIIIMLLLGLGLVYFVCLFIGAANLSPQDVLDVWRGQGSWADNYIVNNLRMPRTACAAVVGAGLSIAGMAMQAMFKNPMASPSILGLSSGASFGACLVLAFGVGGFIGTYAVPTMAFIFCFITMFLVYGLATTKYGVPTVLLLLSGVAVGAFFSGLTSFIQYIVNSDTLSGIVYWTMGSFGRCGWDSFQIALVTIGAGAGLILFCAKELNLISLGEEQATTLGVNIRRVRWTLLIGTSLAVGGSVAICGVIGFVGLIIPHVFRSVGGPNHYTLAPLCILGGGIFMMVMDVTSKTIMSAGEIPVGVLTALLGAPFFIYIMRKHKNDIWGW